MFKEFREYNEIRDIGEKLQHIDFYLEAV